MTHKTDLPALPSWQQAEIARHYNQQQEQLQFERWSSDPDRHPKRTSRAVQAARTTWRWGCTAMTVFLLLGCGGNLLTYCAGSPTPLHDLSSVLLFGGASLIPALFRDEPPAWYVRSVKKMGGDQQ